MSNMGFDTTADCTPHGQQILDAGYSFVARYLSHSLWKNLKANEAKHLSEMGIYIVSVWESAGDHVSFFSYDQGAKDGRDAYIMAQSLGQPKGSPIYFAVDVDAPIGDGSNVHEYFKGVRDVFLSHGSVEDNPENYQIGVYGSGSVCLFLLEMGYVSYTWVAQAYRWEGSRSFIASNKWSILQLPEKTFAGMDIDEDRTNLFGGGWKVQS